MAWLRESTADEYPGRTARCRARARLPAWFRDRHRVRHPAAGPRRGSHPFHLGQEERTAVPARLAAARAGALADHEGTPLGEAALPAHRLPGHFVLLGAQGEDRRTEEPVRGGPEAAGHLREAGCAAARARAP